MTLLNYYYYYFGLFLIIHPKYLLAYQCHQCNGIFLNYSVTIDNLPSPTASDCSIVTAKNSCFVRVGWFNDSTSEVYYNTDPGLPSDSVLATIERRVTAWSGEYLTRKFIGYACTPSNDTPCNTVENLKSVIISTTLPTNEQIQKFDTLIVPTTDFDGSTCSQVSNMTNCPGTNLASCQQCMGKLHHSQSIETCAMCPPGKAIANFLEYSTTFLLDNQTRSDTITLGCRKFGACNSLENLGQIKNTLVTEFDFHKFHNSTTSMTKSSMIILFMIFLTEFFRLL